MPCTDRAVAQSWLSAISLWLGCYRTGSLLLSLSVSARTELRRAVPCCAVLVVACSRRRSLSVVTIGTCCLIAPETAQMDKCTADRSIMHSQAAGALDRAALILTAVKRLEAYRGEGYLSRTAKQAHFPFK